MQTLFVFADKFVRISFVVLAVQVCHTADKYLLAIFFQIGAGIFRAMHEAKRFGEFSKWPKYCVINFEGMNQCEV